jgi:CCDC81-like prokaryotic HU domain 1/CCDC81-like prokaryotic HU domain 2
MHIVESHLSTLFHEHECVVLPGLGGFIMRYRSARVHPTSFIMHPPGSILGFNERLKENDGLLIHSLVAAKGIAYMEAELLVTDYIREIKSRLASGEGVLISKIGRLFYDVEGKLQFSPDLGANYYAGSFGLPEITALPIQREAKVLPIETKQHKPVAVKKRKTFQARNWTIAAAAILVIAILILPLRNNQSIVGHQWANIFDTSGLQLSSPEISAQSYQPLLFSISDIAGSRATDTIPVVLEEATSLDTSVTHLLVSGAFKDASNAQSQMERLRSDGFDAFIELQGSLQLVVIPVPLGADRYDFRKDFVAQTDIRSAWLKAIQQ